MAEGSGGEKTEQATPHKRKEQRKEGNVMQSRDVVTAVYVLAAFCILRVMGGFIYSQFTQCISYWMSRAGLGMEQNGAYIDGLPAFTKLLIELCKVTALTAGVLLIISVLLPVIVTGMQTKFLFSKKSLKFKLDKLNPMKGIKNMFSLKAMFELAKSLVKMAILIFVVYDEIKDRVTDMARLMDMELAEAVVYIASAVFSICIKIAAVFAVVAAADFLFQWYKFEKDMRMTKQEVKEEYKEMEGDPQIKGKRKQKQQQMAMQRMMQDVPNADVVIRNPTHFAVAIRYDEDKDKAPVVVAKGADNIAFRIIERAEEHNITVIENVKLARGLYKAVDIGREIPYDFYTEVAEVLAFVYDMKGRLPKGYDPAKRRAKAGAPAAGIQLSPQAQSARVRPAEGQ